MAEDKPVTQHESTFDMTDVTYVGGYDDPAANVVFVCFDRRAFRIHDYFLKAERWVQVKRSPHRLRFESY
jgi:hypothetical protein